MEGNALNLEELQKQAQEAIDSGDVSKAKELIAQIRAIKEQEAEVATLSDELRELTATEDALEKETETVSDDEEDAAVSEETIEEIIEDVNPDELEKQKDEKRMEFDADMKPIKSIESMNHVDDFENFIRTEGTEIRSLTTVNGSVLVPVDVSTDVLELKDGLVDLTKYVTNETVGTGSGKFPIARRARAILATKAELADIADIDDPMFNEVDYKVETRIGKIAFSNELLEDSQIDVVAYAKKQMQRMVRNTNNKGIIDILSAFAKKTAEGADGLKRVVNVDLDPELVIKFVVNQDAYNHLDTLKDENGRYLLQDAIAYESGKSLFGKEVIVVSNKVAATPSGSLGYMWVGDLEEAAAYFKRSDITAEWEKFDSYSKGLSVGIRSDYEEVDEEAGFMVTLKAATTTTP